MVILLFALLLGGFMYDDDCIFIVTDTIEFEGVFYPENNSIHRPKNGFVGAYEEPFFQESNILDRYI